MVGYDRGMIKELSYLLRVIHPKLVFREMVCHWYRTGNDVIVPKEIYESGNPSTWLANYRFESCLLDFYVIISMHSLLTLVLLVFASTRCRGAIVLAWLITKRSWV